MGKGQLILKGGLHVKSTGVEKVPKKKKSKKKLTDEEKEELAKQQQHGISVMSNKTYEEEFASEIANAKEGKAKSTPWGSGYRSAPTILHGYDKKITGKTTAEQKLDIRSAMKSDKFCK